MLLALALASTMAIADVPAECANAPSRIASDYWDYIAACGCSKLQTPSRASSDYSRYMKACSDWRERNPVAAAVARPEPPPSVSPSPAGAECANPPSRASSDYWPFLDACGCTGVEPPPAASDDFPRFRKACGEWRQDNPVVVSPRRETKPSPAPKASPKSLH